jgi:uncharacterized 2Fe-2S/4Fe-4S cluster protein (DUF4445 family)
MENIENGANDLQNAIVNDINTMISSMCQNIGISENQIYEVTIAGNSTMIHLLLGISSLSIGKSPYAPIFTSSKNILASDIGINIFSGGRIYCLPSVSSYIGADIISGIYVCQLDKIHGKTLFIDIGTNGEIVLSDNGKITSCSCAAGPALEGMNISCGMRASDRAIEDILINESGIEIKVIGNKKARGFCGSGILAAVKEILRTGLIRNDGRFIKKEILEKDDYRNKLLQLNNKKREFILQNDSESLIITQKDIRQIQLAKGAILSGFHALLNHMNLEINKLDKVIIAGQFGSHLPAESLIGCGILPEEIRYKLDYVGNSSKTGAYMALMSKNAKKEMENLSHEISYMELGASSGYERLFADCLIFPKVIK